MTSEDQGSLEQLVTAFDEARHRHIVEMEQNKVIVRSSSPGLLPEIEGLDQLGLAEISKRESEHEMPKTRIGTFIRMIRRNA